MTPLRYQREARRLRNGQVQLKHRREKEQAEVEQEETELHR